MGFNPQIGWWGWLLAILGKEEKVSLADQQVALMIRKRKDPGEGEGQKSGAKEPWKFHEQDYTYVIIMGALKPVDNLCAEGPEPLSDSHMGQFANGD